LYKESLGLVLILFFIAIGFYVQLVPQFYLNLFRSLFELQMIPWQFLLLQKTVFSSYPDIDL